MKPSQARSSLPTLFGVIGLVMAVMIGVSAMPPVGASTASAQTRPESFADLAEALSPAVVNISTSQTVDRPNAPNIPEGPFEDLFRDFFERGQPRGPRQVQSLGSGFVISEDGYVVTNNHVIEDADEIAVNFADGASLDATLIGPSVIPFQNDIGIWVETDTGLELLVRGGMLAGLGPGIFFENLPPTIAFNDNDRVAFYARLTGDASLRKRHNRRNSSERRGRDALVAVLLCAAIILPSFAVAIGVLLVVVMISD